MTITDVPGVAVGHWSDVVGATGVTVVVLPLPNVASVEVRGAAPGTREIALLSPGMRVEAAHAIVLSGGSAFGLASADGVMAELAAAGIGHETYAGVVPIVPAAVLFDLGVGDPDVRPGPDEGAAAYRAASITPVEMGTVGAGTGATVGTWRGPEAVTKGGIGSHALRVGDVTVGALAAVNAVGDVFTIEGEGLTGGPVVPGEAVSLGPMENTTLVVVATDAKMSRSELTRLNVRAHDALAVCLRPSHTRYDGDAVFSVSCGSLEGDVDAIHEAAFTATGRAIEAAIRSATSLDGIPAAGGEG